MHRRICFIPLDSRPVCYDLPRRLAQVARLELCVPSPKLLGSPGVNLKAPADFKALDRWAKNHLFENDPVIAALDTIAYGGLIPSRLGDETVDEVQDRLDRFFDRVKATALFGFSSILRIPNYNFAEEEPDYWNQFGKLLYQYSAEVHELGAAAPATLQQLPEAVRSDFLNRRHRNFTINQGLIKRLVSGPLDYLVFCQDDTGPYGLNVQEARQLQALLKEKKLTDQGHLQTGADEVACVLLARWLSQSHQRTLKIFPIYSAEAGKKVMARFDGLPIETVVTQQIKACGAEVAKKAADADLWLVVHTPQTLQGDHCERLRATVSAEQRDQVVKTFKKAFDQGKPVILADVAYANGCDPDLTPKLLQTFPDLSGLYGYAGWNTPGNTMGTALAMGIVRVLAESKQQFDAAAFKELLLIRMGDDWLYQADVRYQMRRMSNGHPPDEAVLNVAMADGLEMLQSRLGVTSRTIRCRFPCHRTFEIEIALS
jgi:hypothetical protein